MPAAQKITPELLRRRAEHNDGDLETLQEITLHQFDIEKIENIDIYCKRLKIIYLQNNQITKIENLTKLKELEYLNLALNNISMIENLEGCESLHKLDLTLNFIGDLFCLENLVPCEALRELYLTGNPMTKKPGYREFAICTLPQLHVLDGQPVTPTERIQARQSYGQIKSEVSQLPKSDPEEVPNEAELETIETLPNEQVAHQFQTSTSEHSIKARMTTARQLAKIRKEKEPNTKKLPKPRVERRSKEGQLLQCNEGKYPFEITETPALWILKVQISKFLDSKEIQVNLFEDHVKIVILDKLLQIRCDPFNSVDRSLVQRSQTTGELVVYMVRADCAIVGDVSQVLAFERKQAAAPSKLRQEKVTPAKVVSPAISVPTEKKLPILLALDRLPRKASLVDKPLFSNTQNEDVDFEDDPSVPPLV